MTVHNSRASKQHLTQLAKTEMCRFYMRNRCSKGSACPFAHDANEIRLKPDLQKTSMCRVFMEAGVCHQPGCTFAHSGAELRTQTYFFKTKICRFANTGRCKHGSNCRFAHDVTELALVAHDGEEASLQPETEEEAMYNGAAMTDCGVIHEAMTQDDASVSHRRRLPPSSMVEETCPVPEATSNLMSDVSTSFSDWAPATDWSSSHRSASASAPDCSGEEGQDARAENVSQEKVSPQVPDRPTSCRRPLPEPLPGHSTTVMISNIPVFMTQGSLLSLLEDLIVFIRDAFDFFYCPWDPYQDINLGYVVINFLSSRVAVAFMLEWENQRLQMNSRGSQRMRVGLASLQGHEANLQYFSSFSLAHHRDPRFRPLVRTAPGEALRPMDKFDEKLKPMPQFISTRNCSRRGMDTPSDDDEGILFCSAPPPTHDLNGLERNPCEEVQALAHGVPGERQIPPTSLKVSRDIGGGRNVRRGGRRRRMGGGGDHIKSIRFNSNNNNLSSLDGCNNYSSVEGWDSDLERDSDFERNSWRPQQPLRASSAVEGGAGHTQGGLQQQGSGSFDPSTSGGAPFCNQVSHLVWSTNMNNSVVHQGSQVMPYIVIPHSPNNGGALVLTGMNSHLPSRQVSMQDPCSMMTGQCVISSPNNSAFPSRQVSIEGQTIFVPENMKMQGSFNGLQMPNNCAPAQPIMCQAQTTMLPMSGQGSSVGQCGQPNMEWPTRPG